MSTADCRTAMGMSLPEEVWEAERTRRASLDPRTPHFGSKTDDADACSAWGTESTAESTDAASTGSPASGDELWAQAPASKCEAPPGLPSAGSVLHGLGECEPCAWFWKPQGCMHGQNCFRCHLCPNGEIKARKAAKLVSRRTQFRRDGNRHSDSKEDLLFGLGGITRHTSIRGNERQSPAVFPQAPEVCIARDQAPPPQPALRSSLADAEALGLLSHAQPLLHRPAARQAFQAPRLPHQPAARQTAQAPAPERGATDAEVLGLLAQGPPLPQEPAVEPKAQEPLAVSRPAVVDHSHLHLLASLRPPPGLESPFAEASRAPCSAAPAGALGYDAAPAPAVIELQPPRTDSTLGGEHAAQLDLQLLIRRPEPSAGSARHGLGLCEPCAWFWKPEGCQNGPACSRCHLCPKGEVKFRKARKKAAMKTVISTLG